MKFKIERLGGTQLMQNTADICANCGDDAKCRRRDFSEQAWSALLLWGEVTVTSVDQPICEHCYGELREVLIDRADEIAAAANAKSDKAAAQKIDTAKRPAATAARPSKVRKAS